MRIPVTYLCLSLLGLALAACELRAESEREIQVEARGPLHEAFAQPWEKNPAANEPIAKQPPDPIPEEPPDEKPAGANVQWIPGYWQWDEEKKDFIWISGFWRDIPSGRRWIMGYWSETPEGWRWVNGHWAAEQEQDYQRVPAPPENIDEGPSTPAPDDDSFYIPGTWFYTDSGYRWRTGYWAAYRPGLLCVPARYIWTPRGYIFASGFWDLAFASRGLLYAPVYFTSRLWLTPGWYYRPTFAISTGLAFNSFFVRAGYGHYFFGDYYGARYAGFGYQPWVNFGVRQYDPIFAYERWNNRQNAQWLANMRQVYDARVNGAQPLPPRTLADQQKLGGGAKSLVMLNTTDQLKQAGQKLEKVSPQQRTVQKQNVQQIVSRSMEQSRTAPKAAGQSLPPYQPPARKQPATGANVSNTKPPAAGGPSSNRGPGQMVPDLGRNIGGATNPPGSNRSAAPSKVPSSPPATIAPRSGSAGRSMVPSSPPSGSRPVIGGGSGGRPSMPNIGGIGGGGRPSMPNIGGGGGGGRPSMPNIGGGGGGGRPPGMPNIGGGGGRPGGGKR